MVGELFLLGLKPVEARADQALDAGRDRDVLHLVALPPFELEQPFLAEHPHGLLEEEWIAAGVGDERLGERRDRECRVAGEATQQRRRLLRAERVQVDGAALALSAEEARRLVFDLGPSGRDDRERHFCLVGEEIREQLEQRRLGPVQILDHNRRRPLRSEQLEDAAEPPVELGLGDLARRIRPAWRRGNADQVGERGRDRPELVEIVGGERFEEGVELLRARLAVVALQDPSGGLEDLHDRPVRDALAIGEALPAMDGVLVLEAAHEFEQ
jgi:hypothetical protein